jgi:integrase
MQVPAADPDGFVTYDELSGPDLDAARWSPARLLLPTGSEHIPLDPNAELAVGGGEVRVTIPRFSLSHHQFQSAESPKYLIFSTSQFAPPPDRPATRWPTGDRQARPYHPRHTFATEALAAGVSIFELARLMGTSVKVIDKTYRHLARDSEAAIRARHAHP